MTALLAAIAAGAAVVTASVNVLRGIADKDHTWPNWALDLVALAVGVGYALGWSVDLSAQAFALVPALAGDTSRLTGVAGQVLTGLAFGAGATFLAKAFNALGAFQVNQQAKAFTALNGPPPTPPKKPAVTSGPTTH